MGTALIVVTVQLAARLKAPPFTGLATVVDDRNAGDGLRLLTISSPLLDPDCETMQEIIVEGDSVRFKPARDHDIGAGRAFDIA